jgi:hypothetical protein
LQYTGLSGFGSKGTLSSLPQSAHVQGYIVLSSDMFLGGFHLLSTIGLFWKNTEQTQTMFQTNNLAD